MYPDLNLIFDLLWILYVWIGCAIVSGVAAFHKNRHAPGWFFLALIFGPMVLLAVAFTSRKSDHFEEGRTESVIESLADLPAEREGTA